MAVTDSDKLSGIISQLKKQNQLGTRDRLREAEEAKRQELLMGQNETVVGQGESIIGAGMDFQRRFLAGQAKTLSDRVTGDAPKGKNQLSLLKAVMGIASAMKEGMIDANKKYQDGKRDKEEARLEMGPSPAGMFMGGLRKGKWLKEKDEETSTLGDAWKKSKFTFITAALIALYAASEGFNLWAFKAWKGLKGSWAWVKGWSAHLAKLHSIKEMKVVFTDAVKMEWAKLTGFIRSAMLGIKLAVYRAFGFGIDGKRLGNQFKRGGKGKSVRIGMFAGLSVRWLTIRDYLRIRIAGIRTDVYRVFGLGVDGKPLGNTFKGGVSTRIGPLGWIPRMWTKIHTFANTRLTALQQGVFRMAGLGVDGKALGNRFTANPQGGKAISVAPNWQTKMKGGFGKALSRINRIVGPFFKLSAAIVKFLASAAGISLTTGMKTVGKTFGKLLGRILWPITLIFALFSAFKSGKEEHEREGSNWITVIGETLGGFWGYIIGGFADVIKNIVIWLIQKAFGLETDEDGKIIGDGLGVKVLNIIKEFSFTDLVRKIIAMPWHLISNIFEFVKGMFTSADYRAGVWDWITSLPGKIAEWAKGLLPKWLQKAFGIETDPDSMDGTLIQAANRGNMSEALKEIYKKGGKNPATENKWGPHERAQFIESSIKAFMNDADAQARIAAGGTYEAEILRQKVSRQVPNFNHSESQSVMIMNFQTGVNQNYLYDAIGKTFSLSEVSQMDGY
jgi:hypothetical protein